MFHHPCRTKPDQDTRPDLPCVPVVYEEVATSSTNASPDVADETMAKRQNGGTEPKTGLKEEEQEEAVHEVKEEEEGERKEKVQETPTGDGSDDNSQEASEKEEQPAGELHCGEAGDEEQVPAQGGPGSRLVARHLFLFCFGCVSDFTHIHLQRGFVLNKKKLKWPVVSPQCHR